MARKITDILSDTRAAIKTRVAEIYTYIHNEISTDANLNLTSNSNVADWELWAGVMAVTSKVQEDITDQAKVDITAIKNSGIGANKTFFASEWKKFQYGDALLVDDETKKYYYAVPDESKQIIKRLAIFQGINSWEVKVAKETAGVPGPLTTDELNAFKGFVDKTAPPGPIIPVISRASDKIRAEFTVYYDALVPLVQVKASVEAAYMAYINAVDIEGDSRYYITKHIDALQSADGVVDVEKGVVQARIDEDALSDVNRFYDPLSGYLEIDGAYTLATLLTYEVA